MRQTIRVDQVLREAVRTPYRDLVTRPTGAAVRHGIQRLSRPGSTTLLDFSDVGLVDFSCADEVVARLLLDAAGETYFALQGIREDQLEAIEQVLEHHALAVLVHDPGGGEPRVLGPVGPDLRTVFFHLHTHGPLSTATLAGSLDWLAARVAEAVETLCRLRLVREIGGAYCVLLWP